DSMMAVRIKNRVEYDFDLPPIQLQAVRDANLYAVEQLIQYAIEHRDEVEELHEYQKKKTADEIAEEQARLLSGASVETVTAPAADAQAPPAQDAPPPPPPDNPEGPPRSSKPDLAGASAALSQEAVTEALGADVPPRDASERVTFATWAVVTGKSPGGIFNPLPKLDDAAATK